jgi:hypothetical protein
MISYFQTRCSSGFSTTMMLVRPLAACWCSGLICALSGVDTWRCQILPVLTTRSESWESLTSQSTSGSLASLSKIGVRCSPRMYRHRSSFPPCVSSRTRGCPGKVLPCVTAIALACNPPRTTSNPFHSSFLCVTHPSITTWISDVVEIVVGSASSSKFGLAPCLSSGGVAHACMPSLS